MKGALVFVITVFLISFSSPVTAGTYEVKSGDTLWRIAQNNNIAVEDIMSANDINSCTISVGQTLDIPNPSDSQNETNPDKEEQQPSRQGTSDYGEYLDWSQAKDIYSVGSVATVTHVSSGLTFEVKRRGGSNHADSEPRTASDTAVMKEIYGGSWSWSTRAIIVSIDGKDIAASMNGMPHGGQNIHDNNFSGHFCIHFKNSRTHNTNSINPKHQASVKQATGIN